MDFRISGGLLIMSTSNRRNHFEKKKLFNKNKDRLILALINGTVMILYHNRDVDKHTEDLKLKVYLVIRLMTESIIAIIDYKMLFY